MTRGDKKLDLSLIRASEAGGKGLFTKELEDALLSGAIDVAVHSLKDLPGHNPPGLEITAVLERAPTADVLITRQPHTLRDLPQGALLGTSSVRRARQLQWLRPDVRDRGLARQCADAVAQAGGARATSRGSFSRRRGWSGWGTICAEGRSQWSRGNSASPRSPTICCRPSARARSPCKAAPTARKSTAVLQKIDHRDTHLAIRAERELQRLLAGDCALPVGVRTRLVKGRLEMEAILFGRADQGPREARAEGAAEYPEAVAREVFARMTNDE